MASFSALVALLLVLIWTCHAGEVFESLSSVPYGWSDLGQASGTTKLDFRISLKHENQEVLNQITIDVSNPGHPRDDSTSSIHSWLADSGISLHDITDKSEWIYFTATVAQAEQIFNTSFNVFQNTADSTKIVRTLQYSLPENIAPLVNLIHPTTRFSNMKTALRTELADVSAGTIITTVNDNEIASAAAGENCSTLTTPACLRSLYNIGDYYATPSNGSLFGVCGFLNEYARYNALESFLDTFAPYVQGPNANFTYELINGGLNNQTDFVDDDSEANLDMQYAMSIGYNTPIVFYSTGGVAPLVPDLSQPTQPGGNEPYLDFLEYMLDLEELPQTITASYDEDEQNIPLYYTTQVCNMFGQLGARGVSVIFSTGDTGVGTGCLSNDGKNKTEFLPKFPPSCPWVTTVGATYGSVPEGAASFSSGGFSNRFARPEYQDDAVSTYLTGLGDKWKGYYNASGRGFPDVAAQGVYFQIVTSSSDGSLVTASASGTSASAPTFAGIISLLNNALLQKNRPPLGFLNPWLYKTGFAALNDITTGGSTGCTAIDEYTGLASPVIPYASWNATAGWDPVTGLGTPDFAKLMKLLDLTI